MITNSVERSGAPIALLRLMKWGVANRLVEPTFLAREGGDLLEEFRELGPVYRLVQGREEKMERMITGLPGGETAAKAARYLVAEGLRQLCRRRRVELIYANTATHHRVLSRLAPLRLPVITHVHEMERALTFLGVADDLRLVIGQSQWLLAVSEAVRSMLVSHGADARRISIAPPTLDDGPPLTHDERRFARENLLNVDSDTIVVAGCGSPSLIKGTDLFLQVAHRSLSAQASASGKKLVFAWIGASSGNAFAQTLAFDAGRLGITPQVRILPRMPKADRLLAAVEIFLSPSREDSNPLAAIESAAGGRPAICFRGAGGADELADAGGALAVPYLDTDAMADAVIELANSAEQREALGDAGRRYALQRHSPDAVGGVLADVLHRVPPRTR